MRTLTPITLQAVSFAFAETPILDRFTLHIEPGRIVALPLRLAGTSGAPARVLAEPDEA